MNRVNLGLEIVDALVRELEFFITSLDFLEYVPFISFVLILILGIPSLIAILDFFKVLVGPVSICEDDDF